MLKRRIYSLCLLSVILPIIVAASFHHHEHIQGVEIDCDACAEHTPHAGHIFAGDVHADCPLCQFLSEHYLTSTESNKLSGPAVYSEIETPVCSAHTDSFNLNNTSRAPPVSFYIFG